MQPLVLTGNALTIRQVREVAREGRPVALSPESQERLRRTRGIVERQLDSGRQVYGFNVGVGWNKDVALQRQGYRQYNESLIRSHCVSVPPYASDEEVRAVLLARLNTLLCCRTGVSPGIPQLYAAMLNAGIHPLVPERGSVGEGDIGCLAHIGSVIIGEGEVRCRGEVVPAAAALRQAGLEPVELGPKDGLAIVCSNALSAGQGAVALYELRDLLLLTEIVYAMSLEGLNGNVTPLHPAVQAARPYPAQQETARRLLRLLEGSYLLEEDPERPLQDPLSYRDIAQVHGAAWQALAYAEEQLLLQLNSSDDNPCLVEEEETFLSSANYEPLAWVLGFEMLGIALAHVSRSACMRMIKLVNPAFTGLSRFLSPGEPVICFGTIQKTFVALDTENRHLANPSSIDGLAIAGDIEDRHTNATHVVQRIRKMVDNLRVIFAIELLHAAQAMDLRKDKARGRVTGQALAAVREVIPFYGEDRNLSADIAKAVELLRAGRLLELLPDRASE